MDTRCQIDEKDRKWRDGRSLPRSLEGLSSSCQEITRVVFLNESAIADFIAEMTTLSKLQHPNVVQFLGASLEPPDALLVTEFAVRGSLLSVLEDRSIALPFPVRFKLILGTVKGMNYLHTQDPPIIHRDLKSPNILVMANFTAKVADFGVARRLHRSQTQTSAVGTANWTAPEVLKKNLYTSKADVYSFGLVLWEIIVRRVPFEDVLPFQLILRVTEGMRPTIPQDCPGMYQSLMTMCWQDDYKRRPSFSKILTLLEAADQATVFFRTSGEPNASGANESTPLFTSSTT